FGWARHPLGDVELSGTAQPRSERHRRRALSRSRAAARRRHRSRGARAPGATMSGPIVTLAIRAEQDVVLAHRRARQIAELLGLEQQDPVRIATALSEVARNACKYAGGGRMEFWVTFAPPALVTRISDSGGGILDLRAALEGRH